MTTLPFIAWENLLESVSSLVASSEAAGWPVEKVADSLPFTRWQAASAVSATITALWSSAQAINSWCLYGHNLGAATATVTAEWTANGGSSWTPFSPVETPTGSEPIYARRTAPVSADGFRWTIAPGGATVPEIGILHVGQDLELPEGFRSGFVPPLDGQIQKTIEAFSRTGYFLGLSVERTDADITLALEDVLDSWVRLYWRPFMARCQNYPFFLQWNATDDATGAAFCSGAMFDPSSFTAPGYMRVGLRARASV